MGVIPSPAGRGLLSRRRWAGGVCLAVFVTACASHADSSASPLSPPRAGEVGLVEVPAQADGAPYATRMFYAFRPSDDVSPDLPLLVVFNGGPEACTTCLLAGLGTGPYTIDPSLPVESPLTRNDASWTRFANLLYVDERQAGFSYGLGTPPTAPCAYDSWGDAADYLRVVLWFLDAHAEYTHRKVVFVGESYGGTRASLMLYLLLHPGGPEAQHAGVGQLIASHLANAGVSDATVQFVGAALLEPLLAGGTQVDLSQAMAMQAGLPPLVDDTRDADGVGLYRILLPRIFSALGDEAMSTTLFGVDLGTLSTLRATARKNAFRLPNDGLTMPQKLTQALEGSLESRWGPLAAGDAYFVPAPLGCVYDVTSIGDFGRAQFLDVAQRVRVFITNAKFDTIVYGPSIAPALSDAETEVTVRDTGAPVYQQLVIHDTSGAASDRVIPFVAYDAGHMIEVSQPEKLAGDLENWLAGRL